jgi:hypothetical protein
MEVELHLVPRLLESADDSAQRLWPHRAGKERLHEEDSLQSMSSEDPHEVGESKVPARGAALDVLGQLLGQASLSPALGTRMHLGVYGQEHIEHVVDPRKFGETLARLAASV